MQTLTPSVENKLAQIETLLATSIWQSQPTWHFRDEYPLVLSPERFDNHSQVLIVDGKIVAHLSLLPRTLLDPNSDRYFSVGFIGNVATHIDFRGQGLQTRLFNQTAEIAQGLGIDLLILWSDLNQFYQKLGFSSIGQEKRYLIVRKRTKITSDINHSERLRLTTPSSLTNPMLQTLLPMRQSGRYYIQRTVDEFRMLLNIPNTKLFIAGDPSQLSGYVVVNRGSDMHDVIHEWGFKRPQDLQASMQSLLENMQREQLLLLTPSGMAHPWQKALESISSSVEIHPMALAKIMGRNGQKAFTALSQSFIWGLDSI
jgi:predicted N-acetyltransferase YhbS